MSAVVTAACSGEGDSSTTSPTARSSEVPQIAYQWLAGEGDGIYLVGPDGSAPTRILAELPNDQIHPDFSADGTRLAFIVSDADTGTVWTARADGSEPRQVADCVAPCLAYDFAAWSPQGDELLLMRYNGPVNAAGVPSSSVLERLDLATGRTMVVVTSPAGSLFSNPRWSPDAASYCVTEELGDTDGITGSAIAVGRMDGTPPQRITDPLEFGAYCDWSPTEDLIVFTTHDLGVFQESGRDSNLYTIRPDGTDARPLTHYPVDGTRATQPRWTPDGRLILFTKVDGPGMGTRVMAAFRVADGSVGPATGDSYVVGTHPTAQGPAPPASPPSSTEAPASTAPAGDGPAPSSGGRIIFSQEVGPNVDLFSIRPDGQGLERLTRSEAEAGRPDVSPDGGTIGYEDFLGDSAVIALIDRDGGDRRVLTPDGFQGQPAWSPDGGTIVFERDPAPGNNGVWLMAPDGSDLRRLTRNPFTSERATVEGCACDTDPTFAPDGKRISFVRIQSESDGTGALFVMDIDGSNLTQLTPWDFDPGTKHAWHPDGSQIMVSSNSHPQPGESSNLYVLRPDGTGLRALTDFEGGSVNALAGSWSPDGRQMVLKTDESGDFQLYLADAEGRDRRRITSDLSEPRDITWAREHAVSREPDVAKGK